MDYVSIYYILLLYDNVISVYCIMCICMCEREAAILEWLEG